jgi:hypothetical protein
MVRHDPQAVLARPMLVDTEPWTQYSGAATAVFVLVLILIGARGQGRGAWPSAYREVRATVALEQQWSAEGARVGNYWADAPHADDIPALQALR